MTRLRITLFFLMLAVVVGCGSTKTRMAKVSGKVTLDDKPLPEGVIIFTKDGEIPREIPIVNGSYEGQVIVGANHIQFAVYRKLSQPKATGPGAEGPSMQNILPSRYNQESTESRQVKGDGPNQFDFQLRSK